MTSPIEPVAWANTIRATWIDPTGEEWELSGPDELFGWFTTSAIGGVGAATITIVADPLASGGQQVRHIRTEPRRLTWPLHVHGDDHMQFTSRWRSLMRAFTMTSQRGPGILRVRRPDGSGRDVAAYYEDGFRGEAGRTSELWLSANPVLTLYCPDGYWRDTTARTVERSFTVGASFLGDYPRISSSRVLGSTVVVNPGDVEAWPQWTITGPMTGLTATNNTLAAQFSLAYTLAAGQQITISTDVTQPTVRGPSGQNLSGALDWPAAVLWPLAGGSNGIDFAVSGAGVGTKVSLVYHPRYEAW